VKEISELNLAGGVRYAEDHEWIRIEGETARVGIKPDDPAEADSLMDRAAYLEMLKGP
jgi:glycine cleavage system H lipoate-binding protein